MTYDVVRQSSTYIPVFCFFLFIIIINHYEKVISDDIDLLLILILSRIPTI